MTYNVMSRIYSNRQPQGPVYDFDTRISSQQRSAGPGRLSGILTFPGVGDSPDLSTGRLGLTILAVGVLAVVGFNVWTHAYQS